MIPEGVSAVISIIRAEWQTCYHLCVRLLESKSVIGGYTVANVGAVCIFLACFGKLILVIVCDVLQYSYCVRNRDLFITVCVTVLNSLFEIAILMLIGAVGKMSAKLCTELNGFVPLYACVKALVIRAAFIIVYEFACSENIHVYAWRTY